MIKSIFEQAKDAAALAYPVFQANGWEYWDGPPAQDRLEAAIFSLLWTAHHENVSPVSTGRFSVSRFDDGSLEPRYEVSLILDSGFKERGS